MTSKLKRKQPYLVHISETRHFEFELWATDDDTAKAEAQKIWKFAVTTGQWELPDQDTRYIEVRKR